MASLVTMSWNPGCRAGELWRLCLVHGPSVPLTLLTGHNQLQTPNGCRVSEGRGGACLTRQAESVVTGLGGEGANRSWVPGCR